MSFRELNESLFDSTLRLPLRGKTYVFESPDAKTGLWVQQAVTVAARAKAGGDVSDDDLAALQLDDDEERDLYRRAMGATFDEMLADKVPWEHLKHAATTVLIWITSDREKAEAFWNVGATGPKAPGDRKKATAKSGRRASRD